MCAACSARIDFLLHVWLGKGLVDRAGAGGGGDAAIGP